MQDTFTYTLSDQRTPPGTSTGTVTVDIAGTRGFEAVGSGVFYQGSSFGEAFASDKSACLAGSGPATEANFTNYKFGITEHDGHRWLSVCCFTAVKRL